MTDDLPFEPGSDSDAKFCCPICPHRFFTADSMHQHLRDKHARATAAERADAGLEAAADLWAAEWKELPTLLDQIVGIADLKQAPDHVRERFKRRARDLADRLVRAAYAEGFYNGGISRAAFEEIKRDGR